MHEIEPFEKWKGKYLPEMDKKSPFYGKQYNEFECTHTIYNYFIHPQWDFFGANTLYLKVLFVDYIQQFAIIEFIGEWNDCIDNDIMFLKRDVVDVMIKEGVNKFVLIGENVLNFHASDNAYYEEWHEDIVGEGGWIVALGFRTHIIEEMKKADLHYYIFIHERFSEVPWRKYKPAHLIQVLDDLMMKKIS